MGRPPRFETDASWFHVMNRGAAKQPTFHSDRDRVEFEHLLGLGHERFGVELHAYCLMTNHYHLLAHCPQGGLSEYMHLLGSVFTRHHNERSGRDGPLFRGRFHALPIHTVDYRIQAARYIHRNPLDIDRSLLLDRYRWSSHRVYLGHRKRPAWMRTNVILDSFGGDPNAFDRFVTSNLEHEPQRSANVTFPPPELDTVVELVIDESSSEVAVARQGMARVVSLLVVDQIGDLNDVTLVAHFGYPSQRAFKEAVWRARRRADAEPFLSALAVRATRLVA